MTRKEKIQELKNQLEARRREIFAIKEQINLEKVADFYETHNLKKEQHFFYNGKECVGVECDNDGLFMKTHQITKSGEVSLKSTIIYNDEDIKSIQS